MAADHAEQILTDAVLKAAEEYLRAVADAILTDRAVTAGADLGRWPDDSVWRRAVDRWVRPALERVFAVRYRRRTDAGAEQAAAEWAARQVEHLGDSRFPRYVWDQVRTETNSALAEGDDDRTVTARLRALLRLDAPSSAARVRLRDLVRRRDQADGGERERLDGEISQLSTGGPTQWRSGLEGTGSNTALAAYSAADWHAAIRWSADNGREITKTWRTRHDEKVRTAHALVDGESQPLTSPFLVGGEFLQRPHDPAGSPANTYSCRCQLTYTPAGGGSLALEDTVTTTTLETEAPVEEQPADDQQQRRPVSRHWFGILAPLDRFASRRDARLVSSPAEGARVRTRPLPQPLLFQKDLDEAHKGGAQGLANIHRIWITNGIPEQLHDQFDAEYVKAQTDRPFFVGAGEFDVEDPDGLALARKVRDRFLRFVSVDLDDEEVEPGCVGPDNELTECDVMAEDEIGARPGVVFREWRFMGATLVSHPAYDVAFITSVDEPVFPPDDAPPTEIVAAATGPASLPFAPRNTPWDGNAARSAVLRWATAGEGDSAKTDWTKYGTAFAYRAPAGATGPKAGDFKLPYATIVGGKLMAVWSGVTAAAAALQGGRGGVDIPANDLPAVKTRIASLYKAAADQFKDPTIKAPWANSTSASASFSVTEFAAGQFAPEWWQPEGRWFEQPKLDGPTGFTVTGRGRIVGHLAAWKQCHIGVDGRCLLPPHSRSDYSWYRARILQTTSGVQYVGLITMDTSHAPLNYGHAPAAAHYENTGVQAAVVTCGEDEHGIWIAGSVLPTLTDAQRLRLSLSGVSGDWRAVRGELDLFAALAVNVEGFPKARARFGLAGSGHALVGAGALPPAGPRRPGGIEPSFATYAPGEIDPATAAARLDELKERMRAVRLSQLNDKVVAAYIEPGDELAAAPAIGREDLPNLDPGDVEDDGEDDGDDDLGEITAETWKAILDWLCSDEGRAAIEKILAEGTEAGQWAANGTALSEEFGQHWPEYAEKVRKHLREQGYEERHSYAATVWIMRKWCAGGKDVKATTRAKACAASAQIGVSKTPR